MSRYYYKYTQLGKRRLNWHLSIPWQRGKANCASPSDYLLDIPRYYDTLKKISICSILGEFLTARIVAITERKEGPDRIYCIFRNSSTNVAASCTHNRRRLWHGPGFDGTSSSQGMAGCYGRCERGIRYISLEGIWRPGSLPSHRRSFIPATSTSVQSSL